MNNYDRYGTVYTGSQISSDIYNKYLTSQGSNPWKEALWNTEANYVSAIEKFDKSMLDSLSSAYEQYRKQNRLLENSSLIGESKYDVQQDLRNSLSEAYNTYESKLQEGREKLYSGMSESLGSIYDSLSATSSNYASYLNKVEDYYNYIIENYSEDVSNEFKAKFGTKLEDGTEGFRTWSDLMGNENDLPTLYEGDTLSEFGRSVYNMLLGENVLGQNIPSYGKYLSTTDKDLLSFMMGYDEATGQLNSDLVNQLIGIGSEYVSSTNLGNDYETEYYDKISDDSLTTLEKDMIEKNYSDLLLKDDEARKELYKTLGIDGSKVSEITDFNFQTSDYSYLGKYSGMKNSNSKQYKYISKIMEDVKNEKVKPGQVIKLNYGSVGGDAGYIIYLGHNKFVRYNSKGVSELTDFKNRDLYIPDGYKAKYNNSTKEPTIKLA